MRQTASILVFGTVLADAGYDAEHNHRLCREEMSVTRSVIALNRRNTGRRWPKTIYRRALRRRFPRVLYHQRGTSRAAFSQHKRYLISALTARDHQAQCYELILRVLTHNLMLLAATPRAFQWSMSASKVGDGVGRRLIVHATNRA